MRRRVFACALIAISLSMMTYGTIAYFTTEATARNVITSGKIDIELLEWADETKTTPFPDNEVCKVIPGLKITKIVEAKNTGMNAAYMRVRVVKKINLPDGAAGDSDLGLMALSFDETHWTLGEDGYYYYNDALEPGTVTEPLFASVSFDAQMGNSYQNSTASVDVTAYAVQVAHNGSTALDATGWPAAK